MSATVNQDPRVIREIPLIDDILSRLQTHEDVYKQEAVVALLQNDAFGGSYEIVSRAIAETGQLGPQERYVKTWPKSYFLDLRQRLLQNNT